MYSHPFIVSLFAVFFLVLFPFPAQAQLAGTDTSPGDSCSAFPSGATSMVADADQDGAQVILICDGTTWNTAGVKLYYDDSACGAAKEGTIRYNSSSKNFEGCDGTSWSALGGGGSTLAGLSDTEITSPADGQPLVYDAGLSKWINNTCDEAPDGLNFTDLTGQTVSTLVSSNIIQVSGLGCNVDISITGDGTPEYRICSAADCSTVTTNWTVAVNTINAGDYLQLRLTTSGSQDVTHTASVTVGTVNSDWNVKTVGPKRAFVTSQTYNGNLGGLSGADSKCQNLADAAGLVGTFKAWLSDSATNASDRLTQSSLNYVLVDGTIVANGWSDLTDGALDNNGIARDENGVSRSFVNVYTGTDLAGTKSTPYCADWTSSSFTDDATYGFTSANNSSWTNYGNVSCDAAARLYCLEQ